MTSVSTSASAPGPHPRPRVLLIGAGKFGKHHLRVLRQLEQEGRLTFAGVVVASAKSRDEIAATHGIPVFTDLSSELLSSIDAVDIVTPHATHLPLLRQCLPYASAFVEKPITQTSAEAEEVKRLAMHYGRTVMVGHIYRFSPLAQAWVQILKPLKSLHWVVRGRMIKPLADDTGEAPALEFLHLLDILDVLVDGQTPTSVFRKDQGRVSRFSLRYPANLDAHVELGWEGTEKIATMEARAGDTALIVDFVRNTLTRLHGDEREEIAVPAGGEPLYEELAQFIDLISDRSTSAPYPDVDVGARIVRIAETPPPTSASPRRPRVAVIGGGIFGSNCAIELAGSCDVTLFERNNDLLTEASYVNQYRHHWGYHYPRSDSTVEDIRGATAVFEQRYEPAIIRDVATYYCVAKEGSLVSAGDYAAFCRKHALPFTEEHPEASLVNREKISMSLKTFEPIYDYSRLKQLTKERLEAAPSVRTLFNCTVIGGSLGPDGEKVLSYQLNGVMRYEAFDYVINATYANHNLFASWFGFPRKPIRVDLVEALIMKIEMPRLSFAVMDGPFTNVVPTEHEGIFTLVHISESVLKRFVPTDGLIPPGLTYTSNAKRIIDESAEWFPFLRNAEHLDSRYVFRSVNANREHDDARPSDVTPHGFGCWSILGGKIVNCIAVAQRLHEEIKRDLI